MAVYGEGAAPVISPARVAARAGALVKYGGAALSLALIIGVGAWGYKLVMRDVTGIPVVRAIAGPMRTAPGDPGGNVALYTGLSVNEVAAVGEAAPPEDVLVLAPRQFDLPPEDLTVQSTAEATEVLADPSVAADIAQTVALNDAAASPAASPAAPLTAEQVLALADQIAATATPLGDLATGVDAPVEMSVNGVDTDVIAEIVPASVTGVSTSLRPVVRPGGAVAVAASPTPVPAEVAPTAAAPATVTTAAIPAGTSLVQLGAFESPTIAGSEWRRLNIKFADYMSGKEQIIQQAESGGKTFFRLRAMGFADLSEARRFCSALVAENAACIPVVVR